MIEKFECGVCDKLVPPHHLTGIPLYYRVLDMMFYIWFCDSVCSAEWHLKQRKK